MLFYATTVLLLRDSSDGLEVFMVERHRQIDFAGGAIVFPGGRLDDADGDPVLLSHCSGHEDQTSEEVAFRLCGIRETFEEAGVLLARHGDNSELVGGEHISTLRKKYRDALHEGEITLKDLAEAESLRYACDEMAAYSHWVTPAGRPKRFDTMFYAARVPEDQLASHDDIESVDSIWITPAQALADGDAGKRTVVFATKLNLVKLAQFETVDSVLADARSSETIRIEPSFEDVEGGRIFRIPLEAGFGQEEFFEPI